MKKTRSRKQLPKFLSALIALALILAGSIYGDRLYYTRPTSGEELVKVSVMILNAAQTGGGSGVILKSSSQGSEILTNSHICEVIAEGGVVIDSKGSVHKIEQYKASQKHDLCLVKVKSDLKINIKLASNAPKAGELARIVGHPNLLPVIITEGHFSEKIRVNIMVDVRECTAEEKKNRKTAPLCFFMNGIPITKPYQALVASNLIMPGSSGSPVFNEDGELAAVVFAGGGDLSFAFLVPHEFVKNFLKIESKMLKWQTPKKKVKSLAL